MLGNLIFSLSQLSWVILSFISRTGRLSVSVLGSLNNLG